MMNDDKISLAKKYSQTKVHRVITSLRGRYKRESVSRSRRQGLGLLPTEEENGESVKTFHKPSLSGLLGK